MCLNNFAKKMRNKVPDTGNLFWKYICIQQSRKSRREESGMVLATALIFLLILSLLAMVALNTSILQVRMSGNLADEIKLLQAAEAGLRAGENKLVAGNYHFSSLGIKVVYIIEQLTDACCVYDQMNTPTTANIYRITSKAGWDEKNSLVLQSTYAKSLSTPCVSKQQPIQPGRMSWRQFFAKYSSSSAKYFC